MSNKTIEELTEALAVAEEAVEVAYARYKRGVEITDQGLAFRDAALRTAEGV